MLDRTYYLVADSNAPHRVLQTLDFLDEPHANDLPTRAIKVDQATHDDAAARMPGVGWNGSALVDLPNIGLAPYDVPKLLVIQRLNTAGKLADAYHALKMGVDPSQLSAHELFVRESWNAAIVVRSDDADARTLLGGIAPDGTPPETFIAAILARS